MITRSSDFMCGREGGYEMYEVPELPSRQGLGELDAIRLELAVDRATENAWVAGFVNGAALIAGLTLTLAVIGLATTYFNLIP